MEGVENPVTGAIVTGVQRKGQNQLANTGKDISSNTMQGKLSPGLHPVWRKGLDPRPA